MIKCWFILLLLLSLSGILDAQNTSNSCVKSTEGKDFWFGFMENRNYQVPQLPYYLQIVHYTEMTLISIYPCHVEIYIGLSAAPSYTQTLVPNIPTYIRIPWPNVEAMGSESIQNKAIHLVSDNPLNVYALNWCENSADVAVIYPKEALGNEYFAMCYTPHIQTDILGNEIYNGSGKNSEFLIVATENNTTVNITPTKITDKLQPTNVPFSIILSKGELYQVQSMNHLNLQGQGDLTGSYIKSDKNIAVFSGALATSVPADPNVDSWDHLYEQMPPLPSWGRKFVTVPLSGRSEDRYRVLASQNNTNIRIGGKNTVVLNRGAFYEFVLKANEPSLVESDKPVLLAQYMVSNSVDRPPGLTIWDWDGDPFMVIINPVDQTREFATFVAYDSQNLKNKYYVNIVTKDDATTQILLDDKPIPFQTLANSGYSFAQVKTDKGKHNLKSTESGKGFIAYVYAYGNPESFGYSVGFNVNVKLDLGGDLRFVKDTMLICKGETKVLDAGAQFSTFKWSTGETTQKILVSHQGYFKVTASTTDGCTLSDSVFVFESNPIINLGPDLTTCQSPPLLLDAGTGFSSYKWSTNETTQKISVSKNGIYDVLALNKYGCPARDTVRIGFAAKPKISMSKGDQIICGSLSTTINISANTSNYSLSCSNPGVTIHDLFVTVPQSGNYPFTYTCRNEFGCVSDTTFSVGFFQTPPINFNVSDTLVCEQKEVRFSVLGSGNILDYLWEWGDGSSDHQSKDAVHTYSKTGKYDVQLTVRFDNTCLNSILRKNIVSVVSIPTVDFSIQNNQCLKVGAQTLNYIGSGDELDHYNWDLSGFESGEVIKNPGNTRGPLIFDLKSKPNNRLSLQVVSKFGCVSETKSLQLRRNPAFSVLAQDRSGCAPFSIDLNAITNDPVDQVTYSWDYGNGETGTGSQVAYTYAMPKESYDISITAVSNTTGCSEILEKPQWISVFPVPDAFFIVQDSVECLNNAFTFSAFGNGAGAEYTWNLGDNTNATGKDVTHTYSVVGHYGVSLKVTSSHGCTNQSLADQKVYTAPIPTIGFTLDPATCLDPGNNTVSYLGSATINDKFNWDLTQLDPEEIISNPSTTSGPLIFNLLNKPMATLSLQVVSEYGCKSENKQLTIKRKPVFNIYSDIREVCPPLIVNLKAKSGDQVDMIDYLWDFGDGKSITGKDIAYTFSIPNRNYDISVHAFSTTTQCSSSLVENNFIRVYPKPQAGFSYSPVEIYNDQPDVSFMDQSVDAKSYNWDFGDGTNSDLKNPLHKYKIVGNLLVVQTVFNQYGCLDLSASVLQVGLRKLYVPNAFSPSAQNPIDREFRLWCNGVMTQGYHLKIFSRWFDVVFECQDEIRGWDGKLSNGTMAPLGNYVWILEFTDFAGKAHKQSGTVTLIY